MSEIFRVEASGKYYAIYWGPTLICTVWSDAAFAHALCQILEGTRRMDDAGANAMAFILAVDMHKAGWQAFKEQRQSGR